MKNHIIISLLFLSVGLSQKEYNGNDIIEMENGLFTEKFSDEPITGKVFGYFGNQSNPKKVYIGNLLNGKIEGKWVSYYHSTGKKKYEENYKNGYSNGLSTSWYENGQKETEGTFKDGKQDGLSTVWYENGQKEFKGTFKDGKDDGLWTYWYDSGQKEREENYKDGKSDGLSVGWYKNGQKSFEITYKDGELILKKEWNEDGSVKK